MCIDDKIKSFNNKASSLECDLAYAFYKETQFGNHEKASKYEKSIQDIKSIGWLLNNANNCGCSMALCGGAVGDWKFDSSQMITNTLNPGSVGNWNEGWKGNLFNSKTGKTISISTFISPTGLPSNHTGIRFYEWTNGVATVVGEFDNIIDINLGSYVSFYYSAKQDAYYIKAGTSFSDPMNPTVIKIHGDFNTAPLTAQIGSKGSAPADAIMEIVEELNLLMVRSDSNTIEAISLVDLAPFKTINTTGFPYQKMTWNKNDCNLFLTGQGSGGNAVMHLVDIAAGTVVNHLNDPSLRNNTSIITKAGQLLIMTAGSTYPNNTLQFQKWSTCDKPELLESIDTGILIGSTGPDFFNLLTMSEDKNGNIYVTYVSDPPNGGFTAISVFDKEFNLKYTEYLPPVGQDFGPFSSNLAPSWTNTGFNNGEGSIYSHSHSQNGAGGLATHYMDYTNENLTQVSTPCVELTDDEMCSLINKLNGINKPKQYNTPKNGINSNISYVDCCNKLFVYKQETPALVWTIVHNLNSFPVITTVNSAGVKILGTEVYIDNNTVQITFASPVAGVAYLTHNII